MKTGRNDPCPCGSGRKYKKCCLVATDGQDSDYARISQAYNALADKLLAFAKNGIGEDAMDVALDDFASCNGEGGEGTFEGFSQLFVPWLLFAWRPGEDCVDRGVEMPPQSTVAECFAEKKGKKLDHLEKMILQAATRAPYTFCQMLEVTPGKGFRCKDLLTGREHEVAEQSASGLLRQGDLLFCSLAAVDDMEILLGLGAKPVPASLLPQVEALRQTLEQEHGELDATTLYACDARVRGLYLRAVEG